MNVSYQKKFNLRMADFDATRQIKPSSVLDLFQCVACEHGEELGIGVDAMLEKELVWVVLRVKYEVVRPIVYGREFVLIKTWPLAPYRSSFQREYLITDGEGEALIKGSSEWALIHRVRRRLMPVRDLYPIKEGFLTDTAFEGRLAPIPEIRAEGEPVLIRPGYADLDFNGHVNNTKYADFAFSAYPPDGDAAVRLFRIDFHREVLAGEPLALYRKTEGDVRTVCGRNADGEHMFSAEITFA